MTPTHASPASGISWKVWLQLILKFFNCYDNYISTPHIKYLFYPHSPQLFTPITCSSLASASQLTLLSWSWLPTGADRMSLTTSATTTSTSGRMWRAMMLHGREASSGSWIISGYIMNNNYANHRF